MGLLTSAPYLVTVDAASLARIARLVAVAPIFAKYYTSAMNASVAKVMQESKNAAAESFGHSPSGYIPTGYLMKAITGHVESPWRGVVGVGQEVPYARRREFGFSGMTDSLGRFYPNDPGAFYLHTGLQRSQAFIGTAFTAATELAIRDIII